MQDLCQAGPGSGLQGGESNKKINTESKCRKCYQDGCTEVLMGGRERVQMHAPCGLQGKRGKANTAFQKGEIFTSGSMEKLTLV